MGSLCEKYTAGNFIWWHSCVEYPDRRRTPWQSGITFVSIRCSPLPDLGTMAFRHPGEKMSKSRAFAPKMAEELRSAEPVHVSAEERFEAPAKVWACPGGP
jgi:hypothetical protein